MTAVAELGVGERIAGALVAHSAGDCLGAPAEFCTAEEVAGRYGVLADLVGGGVFGWRPGQGTDDTDQTIAVATSYVVHGGQLDVFDVAARLLAWFDAGPPDVGTTTARALRALRLHGDPARSGRRDTWSAGNGSLMRALGPGIAHRDDPPARRRAAAAALSAITHRHPDCVDACVAYADITTRLLHGTPAAAAVADVADRSTFTPAVTQALATGLDGLTGDTAGSGGVADSLTMATAALVSAETVGLEAALIDVVNRGGDADTNAAIAGGLLGARHGLAAVPSRWVDRLEHRDRLLELAEALTVLPAAHR